MDLASIAAEIERRAEGRAIGKLQEIRKDLKGLSRVAARTIFTSQTIFGESYAYHFGGREELQFNIGFDRPGTFRHGVAFSFEPSRSLPNPEEVLLKSVRRFNEFIELRGGDFLDMSIWEWEKNHGRKDSDRVPTPIRADLIRRNVFVFLGKLQPAQSIDFDLILDDWDRLLEMYIYVEGHEQFPVQHSQVNTEAFRPGCTLKRKHAKASLAQKVLDIELRHNELQFALYSELEHENGKDSVATEWPCAGGRVDVVVKRPSGKLWFYEIKTALSARACIREGLAQVLEYSFWPGSSEPEKLFIVGEPLLDWEAQQYLQLLRERFSLPIDYRHCILPKDLT